jgi:hypothetical protein
MVPDFAQSESALNCAVLFWPEKHQRADPTISQFQGIQCPRWGRNMGGITMTDSEWKEHKARMARYRVMEQETTDPLAARLLHDIVLDLEADLKGARQTPS